MFVLLRTMITLFVRYRLPSFLSAIFRSHWVNNYVTKMLEADLLRFNDVVVGDLKASIVASANIASFIDNQPISGVVGDETMLSDSTGNEGFSQLSTTVPTSSSTQDRSSPAPPYSSLSSSTAMCLSPSNEVSNHQEGVYTFPLSNNTTASYSGTSLLSYHAITS